MYNRDMAITVYYRKHDAIERDPLCTRPKVHGLDRSEYDQVATLDLASPEEVFRAMNVVDGDELPVRLGVRSMMVGDVAVLEDGRMWYCSVVGWSVAEWCKSGPN